MQINIIWDSSTSSAPAAFTTAVNYVVQTFDALITNPITVNIAVGWGEVDGTKMSSGALGESETNGDNYSYGQVRNALLNNATSADDISATSFLPVSSPVSANAQFFVASAQEKALGLLPANGTEIDGWLGISKTANFDYSPTGPVPSNQYYLVGVIEHEMTEDLGRIAGLSPSGGYTIMDLFRYSAPGVRNMTASTRTPAYFSVNNGTTDLGDFNIVQGADFGDWAADMSPDSFLAFSSSGVLNGLSQSDIRLMDALGYTVSGSSTPPPTTYSLSPNPASVNENAGTLTLTVTRSSSTAAGTVFVSTVADQGFANNGNYASLSAQAVNFTAGQSTATVNISINDLGLTSGSENYRAVVLQNSTDPTTAAVASDVFTIVNNDQPGSVTYSLSPNPASVNENAGTLSLTVTRSSSTAAGTVYISTVADQGSANNGNYTNLTAQAVSFTAGQSTATVSIAINDLGLTSGSENYRAVVLPTSTSPTSSSVASDVFTIVNNDAAPPPPPGFAFTPNPATVNENGKSLTLTLTRSNTSSLQIFFASTLADQGSANNGNFNALTNVPIIFGKGQATVTIAIPINDLGLTSGSETYRVVVTPTASGSPSTAVATDVFTIVNNDGGGSTPPVTYSLSPNPASVNENAGTLTLTVTRSSTTSAGTVYVSTVADQGSANNGNYTSLNAQAVNFTAGQSTANVSIAINDLGLTSGSESYRAVVLPTSTSATSAAVASDVFTIVNNDTPPVTYAFTPNPASVNENAGALTLTVSRSSTSSAGTVYVSTVADQGSANNGNFTSLNAQAVNFTAGQSTANVSITIDDLGLTSGSESFRAVVLPTSTSPTSAAVASDVFTIVNNDTPPPVTYSLSPNPASVDENAGMLALTVTRSSSSAAATVYVSTVADQGFTNNGYYTDLNAQAVSFGVGQTTANVSILINNLGLTSGAENFRAVVLPTSTSPTTAALTSDVFTIMNDDPAITYSLSPNPASVNENAGTLTLTVTRSTSSSAGTVYVSTVADQGTANNGYYTNLSAQAVNFAAAQTTANVSISINDLGLSSGSESFRAVVLPTSTSATSAAVASDVFTIVNNDTPPVTYSLSPNPASVDENAGTLTLTVTRSSTTSAGTVFVSTVADQGSANNGNYTSLNAQTVNFTAGQATANVSIAINDLGLTSGSESYRAVALPTSTSPTSAAVASDVFTIVNNDTPPPVTYSLSPNPASVNENAGMLTLTVTRSSTASAGTVYVSTVADQGSANNGNFTSLNAQAVNFTAGQATANVSIAINDLGLTSGSENYRAVVLPTSTSPTTAAVASDVFTIVNNDVVQPPPTGYTFAPNPATVNENAKTLTLTLTRASTSSLQIFYANTVTDQGFANNGNFNALTNLPIVFGPGQVTYSISIPINDLGLTSGSETYRVVVTPTVSGSPTTAIASDTFTIVNNDKATHSISQSVSNSLPDLSVHTNSSALFGSGLGGLAGTGSSMIGLNRELLSRYPTHFAAGA